MEEGQTRPGCRSGENGAEEDAGRGGMTEEDEEEKKEEEEEEDRRHRGNLLCFERYGGGPRNT